MRRLMLLRHAKTEHDAPSGQDQDRRLDDRGRLDAAAIGSWIGRHPPRSRRGAGLDRGAGAPDLGDCRASHQGRDPGTGSPPRVEFLADLYGAEPAQLLQIIRMAEVTDPERLLVVGHNPGMHELALAADRQRRCGGEEGDRGQPADRGPCDPRL